MIDKHKVVIYIASAYTKDRNSFQKNLDWTLRLMALDYIVYNPIISSHPIFIEDITKHKHSYKFDYLAHDLKIIQSWCEEVPKDKENWIQPKVVIAFAENCLSYHLVPDGMMGSPSVEEKSEPFVDKEKSSGAYEEYKLGKKMQIKCLILEDLYRGVETEL